ncbi:C45 family autoproteolytic acyltransferase/hydolase [Kiloniella sp.]|uniref:C45 family autoproteolytic acyltransferase/hydolase n=1 Tax=Kiloniella sp. TaxID=1938587 RepID=UPI003B0250D5
MLIDVVELGWLKVTGTPYEIGYALGQKGKEAVHRHLVKCDLWKEVVSHEHQLAVERMATTTQNLFPEIYDEITGLADGLDLSFDQVFAWNCRGDLLSDTADGCTTVQIPRSSDEGKIIVAHNEDGLPFFDGACFIAEVMGEDVFTSFCYPGSIPGHTFAITGSGMALTANNLRLTDVKAEIPRMVLGRAMLGCQKIDNVRQLLKEAPISGGFHYTLAQKDDRRLLSIEFGGGSYCEMEVETPALHANHAVLGGEAHQKQIITASSRDRQSHGNYLIAKGNTKPFEILRDRAEHCLPIWRRDEDDPDNENTIASAVFEISASKISWTFHAGASIKLLYES